MQIGYARVSTDDQDTAVQVATLKSAGCERIYKEKASGGRWDRPELHRLLDQLRKGDVLVVWKLDRLEDGNYRSTHIDVSVLESRPNVLDIALKMPSGYGLQKLGTGHFKKHMPWRS